MAAQKKAMTRAVTASKNTACELIFITTIQDTDYHELLGTKMIYPEVH